MFGFLSRIVRDQLGVRESRPAFRVFRLRASNEVYAYEEKHTRARVIGKFYGHGEHAASIAHHEFEGMQRLRGYDLVGSPHHVVQPLAVDPGLNCVLVTEFYAGEQFSQAIRRSTHDGDDAHLYWRLKALAYYLATQHNRTANGHTVDFAEDCGYFTGVVDRLRHLQRVDAAGADELLGLQGRWWHNEAMWADRQVWLHGDATPANFIFGGGLNVGAIDLERTRRGDRMFDVGRVAGELQHAFMAATGDANRVEPFLGHFLWEYSCHFPDRDAAFRSITARLPFYMAMNLLRVARNDYVGPEYANALVDQAKRLLHAC